MHHCVINQRCGSIDSVLTAVQRERSLAHAQYQSFFCAEFPSHDRLTTLMIVSCIVMLGSMGLMVPAMHYVGGETAVAKIIAGSLGSLMLIGGFGFGLSMLWIDKNKTEASKRFASAHPTAYALLSL